VPLEVSRHVSPSVETNLRIKHTNPSHRHRDACGYSKIANHLGPLFFEECHPSNI
jgi:hypothetical protein